MREPKLKYQWIEQRIPNGRFPWAACFRVSKGVVRNQSVLALFRTRMDARDYIAEKNRAYEAAVAALHSE